LREVEPYHSNFLERLKEFGQTESKREGIRFEIQVRGTCQTLIPKTQDQLLMIAGEAIRNAFKHARPRVVLVEVTYEPSGLSLEVIDDGVGIDDHIALGGRAGGHFGLQGMRERVSQIGGDMTIQGRAPIGTRLRVWVPATSAFGANVVRLKDACKRA
jgi:signal transduction histidine kinase